MDKERIEEIKARAEAATPGPWRVLRWTRVWSIPADAWVVAGYDDTDTCDAAFIAAARQDIPDLLAAIEEQDQRIAELVTHIGWLSETTSARIAKLERHGDMEGVRCENGCLRPGVRWTSDDVWLCQGCYDETVADNLAHAGVDE